MTMEIIEANDELLVVDVAPGVAQVYTVALLLRFSTSLITMEYFGLHCIGRRDSSCVERESGAG